MKTVVIIQARMGSTRLPGKVLFELGGQTVLSRVVDRVQRAQYVDDIVVATTEHAVDNAIATEADRCGVNVCRGSESDVLARYYDAATSIGATEVVRITADCPFVDPLILDQLIIKFRQQRTSGKSFDYLANTQPRTFPHGLDAELFTFEALKIAHQEAKESFEREHVTPFFYLNPSRFHLGNLTQAVDQSEMRWTLDEPADLLFFQVVLRHFKELTYFSTQQVLDLLERHPEISLINAQVTQKKLRAA